MSENTNPSTSLFDFNLDENLKQNLRGAANWAGLAAIVSFAGSILGLINFFIQRAKMQALYREYGSFSESGPAMTSGLVGAFISFAVGIVLFVFLMKFSRKTKQGVDGGETYMINEGLSGLSVYFRVIGIILIIAIIFMLIGLSALLARM